jgi:hypothetical protein
MSEPRMVVVIPAGPRDDVPDTLRSVLRYANPWHVIVIDDTKGRGIEFSHDKLTIIPPAIDSSRFSTYGQLWVSLAAAFRYAVETTEFDLLLRLDADALLLGPGIGEVASTRFERYPRLGALGAYRIGPDGGARDWTPARKNIEAELGLRGLRQPSTRKTLQKLITDAPGYILGEHILGAAVVYRGQTIRAMYDRGLLDLAGLANSATDEDHLFGLITVAAGYEMGDFSGPEDPMAVRWKGLPAAPEELLKAGKLVTHSVRSWEGMGECEIRKYFADARS